jgi:hypothetical protein
MLLLTAFAALAALIGILLWTTRARLLVPVSQVIDDVDAGNTIRHARRRALGGLGVAAFTFTLLAWYSSTAPEFIGLPLMIAPTLAVATGCVAFALIPAPPVAVAAPVRGPSPRRGASPCLSQRPPPRSACSHLRGISPRTKTR